MRRKSALPPVSSRVIACLAGVVLLGSGVLARMEHPGRFLLVVAQGGRFLEAGEGVMQSGANDCGPAALAHCLRRLGAAAPYPDPESTVALGTRGCRLDALAADAARWGWRATLRRLPATEVAQVDPPAIVHVREGHFLVLEGFRGDGTVVFHDPAVGRVAFSRAAWARRWTGHVLEFARSDPEGVVLD